MERETYNEENEDRINIGKVLDLETKKEHGARSILNHRALRCKVNIKCLLEIKWVR